MSKTKGIVFGKRPILMQRFDGGIRIIHVNGKVEWDDSRHLLCNFEEHPNGMYACTEGSSQKDAFEKAIEFDKDDSGLNLPNYSKFLGYL